MVLVGQNWYYGQTILRKEVIGICFLGGKKLAKQFGSTLAHKKKELIVASVRI